MCGGNISVTHTTAYTLTIHYNKYIHKGVSHMTTKSKTTPKEKMIINLMEEVINILSTCKHLSDPEFAMYEIMKDAVDKEVYYPLYDS